MTMKERIEADIRDAIRSRDQDRLDALRYLKNAIHLAEIDRQQLLEDPGITEVIAEQVNDRRENIQMFEQANRADLVAKESAQLAILEQYLPPRLGADELDRPIPQYDPSLEQPSNRVNARAPQAAGGHLSHPVSSAMNSFALVPAAHENRLMIQGFGSQINYLEIEVDGKRLAHHFVGRLGAHPSHLAALGWGTLTLHAAVIAELLGGQSSDLESGRVAVLVPNCCGDVGCGAFAVRILKESDHVRWTDWTYENGYEPPELPGWPTEPGDFLFDPQSYEAVLRQHLQPSPSSCVARLLAMLGWR